MYFRERCAPTWYLIFSLLEPSESRISRELRTVVFPSSPFTFTKSINQLNYIQNGRRRVLPTQNLFIVYLFKGTVGGIWRDYPNKMPMPDLQQYSWKLYFINFLHCFSWSRNVPVNKNSQIKAIPQRTHKLKLTVKINRSSFWGYHCKSDVVIFAWRVTWNYAFSPFSINYIVPECLKDKNWIYFSNTKFNPFNKKKCLNSYILLIEYAF